MCERAGTVTAGVAEEDVGCWGIWLLGHHAPLLIRIDLARIAYHAVDPLTFVQATPDCTTAQLGDRWPAAHSLWLLPLVDS